MCRKSISVVIAVLPILLGQHVGLAKEAAATEGEGGKSHELAMKKLLSAGVADMSGLLVEMKSKDVRTRFYAVVGLSEGVKTKVALEAVLSALNDSNSEVTGMAAYELGGRRFQPAVPALIVLAKSTSIARGNAICALGQIGNPAALPALIDLFEVNDSLGLVSQIASSIRKIGISSNSDRTRVKRRTAELRKAWKDLDSQLMQIR